jgi:hypothetical protein
MSIPKIRDPWHRRPVLWVGMAIAASVAFAAALAAYAYAGTFARYMADDFCMAYELARNGFLASQAYWFTTFFGRYSSTAAVNLAELIGPRIVPFLPALALGAWLLIAVWTVLQLAKVLHLARPRLASFLSGSLIVFVALNCLPNIVQVLYWQTAMLTYVAPLIFLTLIAGIPVWRSGRSSDAAQRRTTTLWSILVAVLAFVAGGFSDTYAAVQISLFSLALLLVVVGPSLRLTRPGGRLLRLLILAALLGALLAMLVVISAPGNARRESYFPPHPGLPQVLIASTLYSLELIRSWGTAHTIDLLIALVFPALIAMLCHPFRILLEPDLELRDQTTARWLVLLPGLALLLTIACFAPAAWALSGPPPDRVLVIPMFVLTWFAVSWGYLAGLALRRSLAIQLPATLSLAITATAIVAGLLVLGPIRSSMRTLNSVPGMRGYAMQWDARDRDLRAARLEGKTVADVPPMENIAGLEEAPSTTNRRLNQCFAGYYGLKSIR